MNYLKNDRVGCFLCGAVAALAGAKILKSEKTRQAAVNGLAKGMQMQMEAQAKFQAMKEDAQDLCYDARAKAGRGCASGCSEEKCEE